MQSKLKICGLKSIEDVQMVGQFPVSYAGFIFARSKRQVSVEEAKRLRNMLRGDIQAVGVFVHTPIEQVNEIAKAVGLDIIQLHSQETDEDCKSAVCPVWKMIAVKEEASLQDMHRYPHAAGILLDTYKKDAYGGTGETFCWELAKDVSKKYFTVLAGGLGPDNILEAARVVLPQVLDINSAVETNGRKDREKVEQLIRRLYHGV